jgi:competence protein ComEA
MRISVIFSAIFFLLLSLSASAATVDINAANAETIARVLRGIGPTKAAAIVKYRETNGKFRTVEELVKVRGIGPKTLAANRGNIIVASGLTSAK